MAGRRWPPMPCLNGKLRILHLLDFNYQAVILRRNITPNLEISSKAWIRFPRNTSMPHGSILQCIARSEVVRRKCRQPKFTDSSFGRSTLLDPRPSLDSSSQPRVHEVRTWPPSIRICPSMPLRRSPCVGRMEFYVVVFTSFTTTEEDGRHSSLSHLRQLCGVPQFFHQCVHVLGNWVRCLKATSSVLRHPAASHLPFRV